MAGYLRSVTTRTKLLYQQRLSPSVAYVHRDDDYRKQCPPDEAPKINGFPRYPSLGTGINTSASVRALFQESRGSQFVFPMTRGYVSSRNMSSAAANGEGAVDKFDYISGFPEVLTDKTAEAMASQAPAVNEVAIAAADLFFPVAGMQYLIDYVHTFTGFNWWASIAVTTLLIRGITVPVMINQLKATAKLNLIRLHYTEITKEMQNRGMSPTAVAEGQQLMQELLKEYRVTQWTPLKGLLFYFPIIFSLLLAITNMVEKVPSFKGGGAFWFIDLTTPDDFYIFPALGALTFWISVECNIQRVMVGTTAGTRKNISRVVAALTLPIACGCPKAILIYWITSHLFALGFGLVIKNHGVKKFLGVPIITVEQSPLSGSPKPAYSIFEALKKYIAASQPPPSPVQSSKPVNQQISSISVLRQRLSNLEQELKRREKGEKK